MEKKEENKEKIAMLKLLQKKIQDEIQVIEYAYRDKLPKLKTQLSLLNEWIDEFHPCSECKGTGSVYVSYASDDVRCETCTRCKGTGLSTK